MHTIEKATKYNFPFTIDQCPIYIQPASILAEFVQACTYKLDYYEQWILYLSDVLYQIFIYQMIFYPINLNHDGNI